MHIDKVGKQITIAEMSLLRFLFDERDCSQGDFLNVKTCGKRQFFGEIVENDVLIAKIKMHQLTCS